MCTEQCLRPRKEAYHLSVVVDENRRKEGLAMADFSPPTSPEVVITCEVETTTSPSVQVIKLVALAICWCAVTTNFNLCFLYRLSTEIYAGYADLYSRGVATKPA